MMRNRPVWMVALQVVVGLSALAGAMGCGGESVETNQEEVAWDPLVVEVTSGPEVTNQEEVSFRFECNREQGCYFQCRLGEGAFEECVSGVRYGELSEGESVFEVVGEDVRGEESAPVQWVFEVDRVAPQVENLRGPQEVVAQTDAMLNFECSEEGCRYACRLNDGDYEACESEVSYTGLGEGEQVFRVRPTDRAGNVGRAEVYRWRIYMGAPEVEILSGPPALTNERTATFEYGCNRESCSFRCSLDFGNEVPCPATGIGFGELSDGEHSFRVRAIDRLDETSDWAEWIWEVDRKVPMVEVTAQPASPTVSGEASFEFECDKVGCVLYCSLDGGEFEACASGVEYEELADGTRSFAVYAVDEAGNEGPVETVSWVIDRAAPELAVEGPESEVFNGRAELEFECTNKSSCDFECAVDWTPPGGTVEAGDWTVCASPLVLSGLEAGSYELRVRGTDELGLESETSFGFEVLDVVWASIEAGERHSCGVLENGALFCWGNGQYGRLGTGDSEHRSGPVRVGLSLDWASVSAGSWHSCGIRQDGTLWCWGNGNQGRLGIGSTSSVSTPHQVGTATDWMSVTAGDRHSCGIREDGTLWCWGDGAQGRLGVGDTSGRLEPAQVGSFTDWVEVDLYSNHTCGRRATGELYCWGSGAAGRLGTDSTLNELTPVQVSLGADWVDVAVGTGHSCGIREDRTLWCWGFGGFGRLGFGEEDLENRLIPEQVGTETDWVSVEVGELHSCARKQDGAVYCWGYNGEGRLGVGDQFNRGEPVWVMDAVVQMSLGGAHGCVRDESEEAYCWGDNQFGQLGLYAPGEVLTYEAVESVAFAAVYAGRSHSCGVTSGGVLYCWGEGIFGQLGLGDTFGRAEPVEVEGRIFEQVSLGSDHSCGLSGGGELTCWGSNQFGQLGGGDQTAGTTPEVVDAGRVYVSVAAGNWHSCGVEAGGRLYCWGAGSNGQLGGGSSVTMVASSEQVGTDEDWVKVAAGGVHTCGLRDNGSLWCWGAGTEGQLGIGGTQNEEEPVQVGAEENWSAVELGEFHTCGLKDDGSLWCWGSNQFGQLGIGGTQNEEEPVQVDGSYVAVALGAEHTCAVDTNEEVYCWGSGGQGRLGTGSVVAESGPRAVGSGAQSVAAGEEHSHYVGTDGVMRSAGSNGEGQLGNGTRFREEPTVVGRP